MFGKGLAGAPLVRVVHAPIRAMTPVTLETTEGLSGALTLDMLEGLTPSDGTGGVALDIIQDTRAKEKDLRLGVWQGSAKAMRRKRGGYTT